MFTAIPSLARALCTRLFGRYTLIELSTTTGVSHQETASKISNPPQNFHIDTLLG